jgi:LysR family transcriptional regulator (chromosome initiation inhibitor)
MKLADPKLKAFMVVAEHKTVHQAAEALSLTQTAITQRIKLLEEKLGVSLFIRSRKGMELTQEGVALLRHCHLFKSLEETALRDVRGVGLETEVEMHIAAPMSIMSARVLPACAPIAKKYSKLNFRFSVIDQDTRHNLLKQSGCDLAVLSGEHVTPEVSMKPLKSEHYVMVGPSGWESRDIHDLVKNEKIIDFFPEDPFTFNYLKAHGLFEEARKSRHFVNNTELVAFMISQGLGYSVLTTEFLEPFLERHELAVLNRNLIFENPVSLAWYPRPIIPNYFQDVLDALT